MPIYEYSIINDFPNGLNKNQLHDEITANNSIPATLSTIAVSNDSVKIIFTSTLSGGSLTALNNTINNHTPSPESPVYIDASNIADGSVSNSEFTYLNTLSSQAVGVSDTQTLSNKTLLLPTISSITNTGTLTLPTTTDTLIGRTTIDTLTNKTINIANNTLIGLSVFGNNYNYGESLTISTNTTTTFTTKVTFTTDTVPAGDYRVACSYNWAYNSTANRFEGRVTVDGTTVITHSEVPRNASATLRHVLTGFAKVTLAEATHTINLDYRAGTVGNTATILNARLELFRIS